MRGSVVSLDCQHKNYLFNKAVAALRCSYDCAVYDDYHTAVSK
ncbi:hypothetical protein [Candidatus Symbiopectobacterium sp.]|nr:hypothetical protein [Candidatus Symbiopectobacterium sp.]